MFNPVFHFEAIQTARRDHHHALRVAYGLVLLLYLAGEYAAWDVEVHGHSIRWLGRFARATFARVAIVQDLAIVALVPALTAGAIAEEVRRRTLPGLLASRLTEAEIVLGKL